MARNPTKVRCTAFRRATGRFCSRRDNKEKTKIAHLQVLARGPPRVRILAVLVTKGIPLILRPHAPVLDGALVGRAIPFPQEINGDGAGRSRAGPRASTWDGKNRGGELNEKEKEGGR